MAYLIAEGDCINCGKCRRECPTDTIRFFGRPSAKHWVDPAQCIDCDICARVCPADCITEDPVARLDADALAAARAVARGFFRDRRMFADRLDQYVSRVVTDLDAGGKVR